MSHHDRPDFGKFEGNASRRLAQCLYSRTLVEGFLTDHIGSVEELGWYGIALRPHVGIGYLVWEDDRGFFGYRRDSIEAIEAAWAEVEAEYARFDDQVGEGEG